MFRYPIALAVVALCISVAPAGALEMEVHLCSGEPPGECCVLQRFNRSAERT